MFVATGLFITILIVLNFQVLEISFLYIFEVCWYFILSAFWIVWWKSYPWCAQKST